MSPRKRTSSPKVCLSLLIFISAVLILLALGGWQLKRLKEKQLFIKNVTNNLANPPKETLFLNGIAPYSKIKIKGRFIDKKNIYLYGRKSATVEKNGYYLLSLFQTLQQENILVRRGWFSQNNKENIEAIQNPPAEEITAIAMKGEKKPFFVPANDLKNNIWFTLDLGEAARALGQNVPPFYLLQLEGRSYPDVLLSTSVRNLLKVRNDHLEYAITWFSLAGILVIIGGIYRKQLSSKKEAYIHDFL